MVTEPYRELLTAVATTSGALTGLLFVALTIGEGRDNYSGRPVVRQVRAAAALLAFTSALTISLFGLVPGTNIGYPALILGVVGMAFTAAAIRSVIATRAPARELAGQIGLGVLLLLIFGTEIGAGLALVSDSSRTDAEQIVGYALVSSLIVGVARAWELVGERRTGLFSSIAALVSRVPESDQEHTAHRGEE